MFVQPPEDDGGTPITSYLVRYMDIDSGEWVTACTTTSPNATAQGLKPGHLNQFDVSAINKEGQSEPIYTGDPIVAENPYSEYTKIELGLTCHINYQLEYSHGWAIPNFYFLIICILRQFFFQI